MLMLLYFIYCYYYPSLLLSILTLYASAVSLLFFLGICSVFLPPVAIHYRKNQFLKSVKFDVGSKIFALQCTYFLL